MNIFYYIIDLGPMFLLLGLILLVEAIRKLYKRQPHS
jgi:hypothetical protein